MMSAEQNELITRIGPGTRGGALMRHYWQPVALAEELPDERPVKAVRLLGEDFVLFRDEHGRHGLLDRDCPHRGADLAYGRLEDGGLRCLFHGWLFDVDGKCLETPAEPEGSVLCQRVRQRAYPVVVKNGIVFAYLGEGEPPAFPDFDCFLAPGTPCLRLQGPDRLQLAAGARGRHRSRRTPPTCIASSRTRIRRRAYGTAVPRRLGRFRHADDPADARVCRGRTSTSSAPTSACACSRCASIEREARRMCASPTCVFPYAFVIPMSAEMTITQWHVPIDDTSCYWYAIFTSFGAPVDKAEMREQRLKLYKLPDYRPRLGRHNNYGYDAAEQTIRTYTGMGFDINVHDQWAIESQGRIQDRTREHLGYSDKAIVAYRRLLLSAIGQVANGEQAAHVRSTRARPAASAARSPSTVSARPTAGRPTGRRSTAAAGALRAGRRRSLRRWSPSA